MIGKTLAKVSLFGGAFASMLVFGGAMAAEAEPTFSEKLQDDVSKQVRKGADEVADAWNQDVFARGIAKLRHTGVFIDKMEKQVSDTGSSGTKVADVKVNSINTVSAGVVFLPNTRHIALTYTTSIASGEGAPPGSDPGAEAGKVEEIRASIRPVDRVEVAYEMYRLNTYLTVLPGQTLLRIDPHNTTVANGYIDIGDAGLTVLSGGDTARLKVERQRLEGRYYFEQATMFGSPMFVGLFHETFQKPWSSRFEVWYENDFTGPTVGALYSQAKLVNDGISLGANVDPAKLKEGFNLQSAILSASLMDIKLTDNFSLNRRMASQGGGQAFKVALSGEIAYRKSFTSRIVGVVSLFAGYDVNFIDMGRTNTSITAFPPPDYVNHLKGSWVALSSDVTYGGAISLMF